MKQRTFTSESGAEFTAKVYSREEYARVWVEDTEGGTAYLHLTSDDLFLLVEDLQAVQALVEREERRNVNDGPTIFPSEEPTA